MIPNITEINAEIKNGDQYLRDLLTRLLALNAPAEILQCMSQAISTLSYVQLETERGAATASKYGVAAGGLVGRLGGLRHSPPLIIDEEIE